MNVTPQTWCVCRHTNSTICKTFDGLPNSLLFSPAKNPLYVSFAIAIIYAMRFTSDYIPYSAKL